MVRKKTSKKTSKSKQSSAAEATEDVKTELTELEKFYITQKCKEGVSLGDIKKQNISPTALVDQLYKTTKGEMDDANKITAGKLMARKRERGVVTMTEQAASFSDNKRVPSKDKNIEKSQPHIHKLFSD
mgnify:CR=1 FL=1